ncbi:hypothetical protein [Serratia fonticola]|uniref:hypothetical protein n=1 Tax=Serratia fonticola TaxID=47917 RepID=UPI001AEAFBF4|nr:hypothetical protein [Serratia fonticola]MBP1010758.1 hypothetical protein [Serratia fonticola]
MLVQQMYYIDNDFLFNIPAAPYRRRICVPLLMATAFGAKSNASHKLVFNGVTVVEANGKGGTTFEGVSTGTTEFNSWSGFIEANQTATIQAVASTNGQASTPKCINVQFGGW